METIIIDVGVFTILEVDLSEFDFTGVEKVILTAKNVAGRNAPVIFTREWEASGEYEVTITPAESLKLRDGAVYDFDMILSNSNNKRIKISDNGKIKLRNGVGQYGE